MMSFQTKCAIAFIIASVAFLCIVLVVASWDENTWIGIKQDQHPPTLSITRNGTAVWIRWYGGWDNTFIDHIRVCTPMDGCREYVKPRPGYYITYPLVPENTSIEVYGWDEAVKEYRPIASERV